MRVDHCKVCRRLQNYGECVLTATKRVRSLLSYGKCVLTPAKRVGGLYSVGECVLTTAVCWRLAELWRML